MGEGADIGSFGAVDVNVGVGIVKVGQVESVNLAGAGFAFDFDSFAGEFVEGHAVLLDGGNHWGQLLDFAGEGGKGMSDLVLGDGGGVGFGEGFALNILSGGGAPEENCAGVGFIAVGDGGGGFGSASDEDHEQSGGKRVKCATVTDFFEFELVADFGNDVVRGPVGRFVDEENAVEWVGLSVTAAHGSGLFRSCCSSSWRMERMLSPSARDSSRWNWRRGVYLSFTRLIIMRTISCRRRLRVWII